MGKLNVEADVDKICALKSHPSFFLCASLGISYSNLSPTRLLSPPPPALFFCREIHAGVLSMIRGGGGSIGVPTDGGGDKFEAGP